MKPGLQQKIKENSHHQILVENPTPAFLASHKIVSKLSLVLILFA
jgi:hypothetical protein